ncbi:MAG: hypothetical protein K2Q03_01605 [Sphingobacteriaceae bacterium]|nr:hypothetical protein [Sphingobacteriaceae bacterium]
MVQKILKSKFTLLLAYDVYDPNTNITEKDINLANKTTIGDIKYSTFGYGIIYQVNPRIKFTLYNENITNHSTQITNYNQDVKDDVFTARLQYRW